MAEKPIRKNPPHSCQRNSDFAEHHPFYVTFVASDFKIQLAILLTVYHNQTSDEQFFGDTIHNNHSGFAKGNDAIIYSDLARRYLADRNCRFSNEELNKMKTIHRYYIQCHETLAVKNPTKFADLEHQYWKFNEDCEKLLHDIEEAKKEQSCNSAALDQLASCVGWQYTLISLRRKFNNIVSQPVLFEEYQN